MIEILFTLASAAISFAERPDVQQAAVNVFDLVTASRTALNAVVVHSPESATNPEFQALDTRCSTLENQLQAAADDAAKQ
jgi:hypothetical protein